jgi:hypothetical protein
MENVNVDGGTFRPMREGLQLEQTLIAPIGTLAYLHRRFGENTGTLLVAFSEGKVYTKLLDQNDEWVERYSGLSTDDCDWITYEISTYRLYSSEKTYVYGQRCTILEDPEDEYSSRIPYRCIVDITEAEAWNPEHWEMITQTDPVDILLFTNATDGMYCLYGDTLDVAPMETPKKFGVITRYNERVWGSGIIGDPDMMVYSAPYDPFDWEAQKEIPEDGAGDIMIPTWDGDSFQALRQYGSDLIAVKRNSTWRIYGTNPGEFTVQRQYGGGTIVENTLAVYNDAAYMLGENGMLRYNGNGAVPFLQDEVQTLMHDQVNRDVISRACAGIRNQTYCLALPVNGSTFCNAILEYNTSSGAIAMRTGVSIDSFLQLDERLFYTAAQHPGRVFELRDDIGKPLPTVWVSGYQDLLLKSSIKSAFTMYAMIEAEAPVELYVGLRTEKKLKQKVYKVKPGKLARLHLNNHGRIFRLEIRSYSAVPFTIAGGIKLDLELDPD